MTYRPTPDPTSEMSELMETSFSGRTTSTGDIVSGKIVKITGEAAFVDYGAKSDGMVNLAELKDEHGGLLHDVGATLDFVVAETKGYVRLSFRDAQAGKARIALKEAWKKQETVRGRVVGINKGGYEVRIDGVRAFCPLSQLADRFIQDPQSMVGEEFEFRITEWDDHKGAVVSRRALLEAEREKNKEAIAGRVQMGEILQGHVTQIRDFGAFVDIGGIEGLIHVSEMGKKRVKHPSERLNVGDAVEVTVVKIELDKGRVALRLRDAEGEGAAAADPFVEFAKALQPGQRFTGTVARIQTYGAFVSIAPEVDGLLHVSAITTAKRINTPEEVLKVGETVEVVVESVDLQKNRIALCTPEVFEKRGAPAVTFEVGQIVKGRVSRIERFGLFVDIGPRTSGLLPMNECDNERGTRAEDIYPIGTELECKIIEMEDVPFEGKDGKKGGMRKKIRLSRKALKGDSEAEDFRTWRQQQTADQKRGTATLGDLFAKQLQRR
jgi:small subunit ribosomal protein S1